MEIDLSLAQIERIERALFLYETETANEEKYLTNSLIDRFAKLKSQQVEWLISTSKGAE